MIARADLFPIIDISEFVANRPETLGTKEKFWTHPQPHWGLPGIPHLFKVGRPNTGENWAEKVTSEIAIGLGIPTARYELALYRGTAGVLSEQFFPVGGGFMPGNLLFSRVEQDYDGNKRFKQIAYRLSTALNVVNNIKDISIPIGCQNSNNLLPIDYFIGYLMLDALVGNTDRHHENWGLVVKISGEDVSFYLAPSFDCASSLGRSETEERRQMRLETRDQRATVEAYAEKARSAFFGHDAQGRCLTMRECVLELKRFAPATVAYWRDIVCGVDAGFFRSIFQRISADWISDIAIEFAVRLLVHNQRMIEDAARE